MNRLERIPAGRSCVECAKPLWKARRGRPPRFCGTECEGRFLAGTRALGVEVKAFRAAGEDCRRNAEVARTDSVRAGHLDAAADYEREADVLEVRLARRLDPTSTWRDFQ